MRLSQNLFTNQSDKVVSTVGWTVPLDATIYALNGNDIIAAGANGILNWGALKAGPGNDTIAGAGTDVDEGSGIENYGVVNAAMGNDTIAGTETKGSFYGIYNEGSLITGDGNDTVTGTGNSAGIYNYEASSLDVGNGDDTVTGSGIVSGIQNFGEINTGDGSDIVDALNGGFDQDSFGTINLGMGNDTLKGFGSGLFNGGGGLNDKVLFDQGSYTISAEQVNGVMNLSGFEWIGGTNGTLFALGDGTLTVDAQGSATFVAA